GSSERRTGGSKQNAVNRPTGSGRGAPRGAGRAGSPGRARGGGETGDSSDKRALRLAQPALPAAPARRRPPGRFSFVGGRSAACSIVWIVACYPCVERSLHVMKSRFLILIAAALLVVAIGCKKTETTANSTTSTTATATTDTTETTSSYGTTGGTETTGTVTGTGSTGGSASTLSDGDKDFATKAAQGNIAEISGGAAAAQKGTSP